MIILDTDGKSEIYIKGIFQRELKNRFLCEVLIDGIPTECYVPSSCHLSNFLNLQEKEVLLIPNNSKTARTVFAVFAVPFKRNYLILNTSYANRAVEASFSKRYFAYLGKRKDIVREYTVQGYKTDFFIRDTNTIVEIKSIISTEKEGVFPTVYSERSIRQLQKLHELMNAGFKVCFIWVSLNPYLQKITLDTQSEFYENFKKCKEVGMTSDAFTCSLKNGQVLIRNRIPLMEGENV